jgi:hypothetical protein
MAAQLSAAKYLREHNLRQALYPREPIHPDFFKPGFNSLPPDIDLDYGNFAFHPRVLRQLTSVTCTLAGKPCDPDCHYHNFRRYLLICMQDGLVVYANNTGGYLKQQIIDRLPKKCHAAPNAHACILLSKTGKVLATTKLMEILEELGVQELYCKCWGMKMSDLFSYNFAIESVDRARRLNNVWDIAKTNVFPRYVPMFYVKHNENRNDRSDCCQVDIFTGILDEHLVSTGGGIHATPLNPVGCFVGFKIYLPHVIHEIKGKMSCQWKCPAKYKAARRAYDTLIDVKELLMEDPASRLG